MNISASEVATPAYSTSQRLYFVDYVRVALTMLVVYYFEISSLHQADQN